MCALPSWRRGPADGGRLTDRRAFQCNVCGRNVRVRAAMFHREGGACPRCHSTVRFRGLMHALAVELLGAAVPLSDFPVRKDLVGLGMSDDESYATRLGRSLAYTNYFYDAPPWLDIRRVADELR